MKHTTLSTNTQEYRRLRELSIAKSKIQWETIGENDFKASLSDYLFHIKEFGNDSFSWTVSKGVVVLDDDGVESLEEAKEACIEAYVHHILS